MLRFRQEITEQTVQPVRSPVFVTTPWKPLLLSFSVLVVIIAFWQVSGRPHASADWPVTITTISLAWLLVYLVCSWGFFRTPYLLTSTYIICLCVFHLGVIVPHALLGAYEYFNWWDSAFSKWVERGAWYTVLSLGCLGTGFALSMNARMAGTEHVPAGQAQRQVIQSRVFWDGIGLMAASSLFLAIAIASFGNLFSYSREDLFTVGVADTRGLGVLLMLFPTAVLMLVIGAQTRFQKRSAYLLAVLSTAIVMFSGYRGSFLFPFLVGFVLWAKSGRKVSRTFAGLSLAFVIISIPVMGVLRTMGPYQDIDRETVSQSFEEASVEEGFRSMGQIGGVLGHIVRLVPDTDPYTYGRTYLRALQNAIPNIGAEMTRSTRIGAIERQDEVRGMMPAEWLTYRIMKDQYRRVGGATGFSGIGEPYLNFGTGGVIAYFLLLGYLLGRIEHRDLLKYAGLMLFVAVAYWHLDQSVRDEIGVFLKPVVFSYIVIAIWRFLVRFTPISVVYRK